MALQNKFGSLPTETFDIDVKERDFLVTQLGVSDDKPKATDIQSRIDALNDASVKRAISATHMQKSLTTASPATFDRSHYGVNYERYYSHPKFSKLGHNPYRDNETLYNQNSTWWDDFRRAGKQYLSSAGSAIVSQATTWGDTIKFGGETTDMSAARIMDKAMAVGNSSKDGFGASVTNFTLNSAYTMGIISEIALEELAMALGTAATGMAAAPAAGARTGLNIAKGAKTLSQLFKTLNSTNKARQVWAMQKAGNKMADAFAAVMPMGDSLKYLGKLATGDKKLKSMSDFAKLKKGFGVFYRDAREINAVIAESKLEAGLTKSEIIDTLYNEHLSMFNSPPNEQQKAEIERRANLGATQAYMQNLAGIYISNKIVIGTALRGIRPLKDLMKDKTSFMRLAISGEKGKQIAKVYDTSSIRRWAKGDYRNLAIREAFKPKNILGTGMRYLSANMSEGLQEVYQESLQAGIVENFTSSRLNSSRVHQAEILETLRQGYSELDKHGMVLETFLSGFLMAGPTQVYQNVLFKQAPKLFQYATDKKGYLQEKEARQKEISNVEKIFQEIINDKAAYANLIYENASKVDALSAQYETAVSTGDAKGAHDAASEMMFQNVTTLISRGMFDEFVAQLEDMKGLTKQELMEAFGEVAPDGDANNSDITKRLDKAIQRAHDIKRNYDKYRTEIPNPFNRRTQTSEYVAYETALNLATYQEYALSDVTGRMQSILSKLNGNLLDKLKGESFGKVTSSNVTSILNDAQYKNEVDLLKSEIKNLQESSDAGNQELAKQKQKYLDAFIELKKVLDGNTELYSDLKKTALEVGVSEEEYGNLSKTFFPGREAEYVNSQNETRKGKIIRLKANGKVELEIINRSGNKQIVIVSRDKLAFMSEEVSEGSSLALTYIDSENLVKSSLKDLLQVIADQNNVILSDEMLEDAALAMIDYTKLGKDAQEYSLFANILTDPSSFESVYNRILKAEEVGHENAIKNVDAIYQNFLKEKHLSKLLEELYDNFKVFVSAEDLDTFNKTGVLPSTFYKIATPEEEKRLKSPYVTLRLGHPVYTQIAEYIEKFEIDNNVQFTNKLTVAGFFTSPDKNNVEASPTTKRSSVNPDGTVNQDTRTISDLMKMMNFTGKGGKIMLSDLLELLNNSDNFLDVNTIQILDAFLNKLDANFEITFDSTSSTSVSYTEETGLVINPTIAAADYNYSNISFETLLVSALTYYVAINESNDQFTTQKDIIIKAIVDYFNNNEIPQDLIVALANSTGSEESAKDIISSMIRFINSTSNNDYAFINNVMNNVFFRMVLASVPMEVNKAPSTALQKFMQAVKLFLQEFLSIKGNTALDEAVNLIGVTFFDKAPIINTGTFDTYPNDLKALLEKAYNTDTSPEKSDNINDWINESSIAKKIIDNYFNSKDTSDDPLTPEELAILASPPFNYPFEDLNTKTNSEWRAIINNNIYYSPTSGFGDLSEAKQIALELGDVINNHNPEDSMLLSDLYVGVEERKKVVSEILPDLFTEEELEDEVLVQKVLNSFRAAPSINVLVALRTTSLYDVNKIMKSNPKFSLFDALRVYFLQEKDIRPEYGMRGDLFDMITQIYLRNEKPLGSLQEFKDDIYSLAMIALNGLNPSWSKLDVSDKAIEDLYAAVQEIHRLIREEGFVPVDVKGPLFGKINGMDVSGTLDVMLVNDKKQVIIIDLKTSTSVASSTVKNNRDKKARYGSQLNTYYDLIFNQNPEIKKKKYTFLKMGILTAKTKLTLNDDTNSIVEGYQLDTLSKSGLDSIVYELPVQSLSDIYPNFFNQVERETKIKLNSTFNSKIIYVSMSIQNQKLKTNDFNKYENVVYLDEMLYNQLLEKEQEFLNSGMPKKMFDTLNYDNVHEWIYEAYQLTGTKKVLDAVYNNMITIAQQNASQGFTVITSIYRMIEHSDLVIGSEKSQDYFMYQSRFDKAYMSNIINAEVGSGKFKSIRNKSDIFTVLVSGKNLSTKNKPIVRRDEYIKMLNDISDSDIIMFSNNIETSGNLKYGIGNTEALQLLSRESDKRMAQEKDVESQVQDPNNIVAFDPNEASDDDFNNLGNC
jgi:hypothetical protein